MKMFLIIYKRSSALQSFQFLLAHRESCTTQLTNFPTAYQPLTKWKSSFAETEYYLPLSEISRACDA